MISTNTLLYHSTFRLRLPSIKKTGLGARQYKNWEFSRNNEVCLTNNAEVAFSFCESAEDVRDSVYNSGIVVLALDYTALNRFLLFEDTNIRKDMLWPDIKYFAYKGVIDPTKLFVVTRNEGIVGNLCSLKRVPSYE